MHHASRCLFFFCVFSLTSPHAAFSEEAQGNNRNPSSNLSHNEKVPTTDPLKTYPSGLLSLPLDSRFARYAFVVGKKERTLWVYEVVDDKLKLVEKFDADVGKNSGDKTRANDHKTPTGIYFLQKKMTSPEVPFSLYGSIAFTTDYPNIFDKREAKTGSGIWLHAVPDSVALTRGSRGCVVVRNAAIQKISSYFSPGQTPLIIYNEIEFITEAEHQKEKEKFLGQFEKWRRAWEGQDIDAYLKFYHDTFRNDEMDLKHWIKHKRKMRDLYSEINVNLSQPLVIINRDQVVFRTFQKYKSNLHEDSGEKTIHAKISLGDSDYAFKIIREDWRPLSE